ncbi:MAG TPA: hypothetical protein VFT90_17335, partial [Chryseosolibacter sp.]|nr:hypothetical protein [Chryseosolibacter sp.]
MKPIPGSFPSWMKLSTSMRSSLTGKFYMLFLVLFLMTSGLFAQTVTWSESYEQGLAPTPEQHQRWNDFLASLKDKKFASVTLSGTFDETGKTLSDPVAVEQLATLLNTGTAGSVEANGQTWTVTNCDTGNGVFGIGLKVDGVGTSCLCGDLYALRPLALNDDW